MANTIGSPDPSAELGALLGGVVKGVVEAQEKLDDYARSQRARALATPVGEVIVPPLWYTFQRVAVDLELSADLSSRGSDAPRLRCRTLSPAMLGLYGREAAANVRVRVLVAPSGPVHAQTASTNPPDVEP